MWFSSIAISEIKVAEGLAPATSHGVKSAPGITESLGALTVQEFRRGVKRDKSHYDDPQG